MPWIVDGQDPLQQVATFHLRTAAWVPRVKAMAQRAWRRELKALGPRLEDAQDDGQVLASIDAAQDEVRDVWRRFYRQVYVTVGAAFAEDGIPPGLDVRQDEAVDAAPTPWGSPGNPWWILTLRPTLGTQLWWDPWLASTLTYAQTVMGTRITGLNATTRRLVARELEAGLLAGEGIFDLRRRVRRLYLRQIIPHRAEVIARTEVLNAARAGTYHATYAVGIEDRVTKSWLPVGGSLGDGRNRGTHLQAGRDQIDIPFTEPFEVTNPSTGALEYLNFPGDGSLGAGAANVIQCRCDLTRRLTGTRRSYVPRHVCLV